MDSGVTELKSVSSSVEQAIFCRLPRCTAAVTPFRFLSAVQSKPFSSVLVLAAFYTLAVSWTPRPAFPSELCCSCGREAFDGVSVSALLVPDGGPADLGEVGL